MLGISLSIPQVAVLGAGAPFNPTVVRNVASRGQIGTATLLANGAKTRWKGRVPYRVFHRTPWIKATFGNWYLKNTAGGPYELTDTGAASIVKLAIERGAECQPCTFGGLRSKDILAGDNDIQMDELAASLFSGGGSAALMDCFIRICVDIPAAGKIAASTRMRTPGEQSFLYDPANHIDDIDGTGPMATPTGADQPSSMFCPLMLLGFVPDEYKSVYWWGMSISDGANGLLGDGIAWPGTIVGGGKLRIAAALASMPYFSGATGGNRISWYATTNAKQKALMKYHRLGIVDAPTNDTNAGVAETSTRSTVRGCRADMKAAGIKKVYAVTMAPRIDPAAVGFDRCTTLANQSPLANFVNGGIRDAYNTNLLLPAELAFNLDAPIDTRPAVEEPTDHSRFPISPFASTLAAAAPSGATTLVLNDAPPLGESLVLDPGGASMTGSNSQVSAVTGSGPYTVTLSNGINAAQSLGAVVKGSNALDGTHYAQRQHVAEAQIIAAVLQGA